MAGWNPDIAMVTKKDSHTLFFPKSELCLTFADGPCAGRDSFMLWGKSISIGRDEECDVVLSGWSVSRQHCSIIKQDNAYFLIDSSLNGTFVNDQPVSHTQVQLHDSDRICVGQNILIVNLPSEQIVALGLEPSI